MARITLPFHPKFQQPMLAGIKTHTCRSECYGQPGDQFLKWGAYFELVAVWQTTLEDVATNFYRQEGCDSPQEFMQIWRELHPRRGFVPSDLKWLHHFKLVE